MSIITAATFHAMASVESNTGGSTFLTGSKHPGFSAVALAGEGLWDFTLDQDADATQCLILATPRTATADCACRTSHPSDSVKRVMTDRAGALASDVNFDITIFRLPSL